MVSPCLVVLVLYGVLGGVAFCCRSWTIYSSISCSRPPTSRLASARTIFNGAECGRQFPSQRCTLLWKHWPLKRCIQKCTLYCMAGIGLCLSEWKYATSAGHPQVWAGSMRIVGCCTLNSATSLKFNNSKTNVQKTLEVRWGFGTEYRLGRNLVSVQRSSILAGGGVYRWVIDTSLSVCQGTLRRPNTTCDQYQNTLPNIHLPSKCISCTAWLQAAVTQQDPTEPSATRRPKPTFSWQWGNHSPKRKLPLDYSALVAAVSYSLYSEECQPSFLRSNVSWYWSIETSGL